MWNYHRISKKIKYDIKFYFLIKREVISFFVVASNTSNRIINLT